MHESQGRQPDPYAFAKAMKEAIPRYSGEKVMRDPNFPLDPEIEPEGGPEDGPKEPH
jgi:hypothetical protein